MDGTLCSVKVEEDLQEGRLSFSRHCRSPRISRTSAEGTGWKEKGGESWEAFQTVETERSASLVSLLTVKAGQFQEALQEDASISPVGQLHQGHVIITVLARI